MMGNETTPRQWWPTQMCDERMPPAMEDPSGWLTADDGALIFGRCPDEADRVDYHMGQGVPVAIGDVVNLSYLDELGTRTVHFSSEAAVTIEGGEPQGWTCLWDETYGEDPGESLTDYADTLREFGDLPCTVEVSFLRWGDAKARVEMADGQPVLRLIDPEDASCSTA